MIDRATKLRLRRKFRRGRRQVEDIGFQAEEQLDKHLFKKFSRLAGVRRFVFSWLLLIVLLGGLVTLQTRSLRGYYEEVKPAAGGTYTEGMVGNFTNANPLYATGLVDSSISRLLFAGLLKYDADNQLTGDLAEKWSIDETGKVYTVRLRPNLKWHDGQALTSNDVLFTFQTIQNPDAGSPLFASWRGISLKALDDQTISFTLTNPFPPFIYSLTTGIVPKHSLQTIQPAQLRSALFNTVTPVGAGPFKWEVIEVTGNTAESRQQNIGLLAFEGYHVKQPALQRFVIKIYSDETHLLAAFKKQEVNALVGLDHTPEDLQTDRSVNEYNVPLTAENLVFFKNDSPILKDAHIRQALVQAVNVNELVKGLSYPVIVADEPLLSNQLGYNPTLRQLSPNIDQAKKLLDDAEWRAVGSNPYRTKGEAKLELKLIAQNNSDNITMTKQLQKAWAAIGMSTQVTLMENNDDLQTAIKNRDYDALLYGISLGLDPDVFAYWHSSQADLASPQRLNLSDYKSSVADKALEAGRNRYDPALRAAKYIPFLQAWRNDAPALALYQPRFLYISRGPFAGFTSKKVNSATDRFANVENWTIREERQPKTN